MFEVFLQILVDTKRRFLPGARLDGIVGFRFTIHTLCHTLPNSLLRGRKNVSTEFSTFTSFGALSSQAKQSLQIQHFQYNFRKVWEGGMMGERGGGKP